MSSKRTGLVTALVVCPVVAWAAAFQANIATHGRLGTGGAAAVLLALPAVLAASANLALRRPPATVLMSALLAALVSAAGFVAFVAYFLLTVPDEFFT